jgi:hypothetical protein
MALDQLDSFMAAIRQMESGGNYTAIGPGGLGTAKGAYQFIDDTWNNYGGYSRADQAPPEVQDQHARELMTSYYNQFGSWDLVAVAWHAGPQTAANVSEGGSLAGIGDVNIGTQGYVNNVMSVFSSGTYQGGQLQAAPGEQLSPEEFATENFGYLAMYFDDPNIGDILREAAAFQWSTARLEARLRSTDWWQTTQDSIRRFEARQLEDPASVTADVNAKKNEIAEIANRFGVRLVNDEGQGLIGQIAADFFRLGWTPDQLIDAILAHGRLDETSPTGEIGSAAAGIQRLAQDYLVYLGEGEAVKLAKGILGGSESVESVTEKLRLRSKARFQGDSVLGEYIDQGGNPADFFAGHQARVGQLLGIDASAVDLLNDKRWSQITSFNDNGTIRPMTEHEAVVLARGDSRFLTSQTGKSEMSSFRTGILQAMGEVKY